MHDTITVGRLETGEGSLVVLHAPLDEEAVQLLLSPEQARQVAFALVDIADDIDPPAWRTE